MSELSEARKALEAFLTAYLMERKQEKTLSCLTEDLYSVGTGVVEVARDRREFQRLLEAELASNPEPFVLKWKFLDGKEAGGCAEFLGEATIGGCLSGEEFSIEARFTAVMRKEDGVYRASSLHMSAAAETQEDEEFFPVRFAEKTICELRDEMSHKALEVLSNSIPGGMMGGYLEEGWPLYFVNDRMLRYLGYTYDEFVADIDGRVVNCMHPDDQSYVTRVVSEAMEAGDDYEVEYRMRRKDGSYLWILDKGSRIMTPTGREAILSVCVDITDSRRMQAELEEKTARLEENNRELQRQQYFTSLMLSNNTVGMLIVYDDPSNSFAYVGDNLMNFLGYGKEEFERTFSAMRQLIVEEDWPDQRVSMLEQLGRGDFYQVEYRVLKKDGTRLWVQEQGQRSIDDAGRAVFICTLLDVSQHKRRQALLLRQSEQDSLTRMLNRGAGIRHITEYLDTKPEQESCALFLLDLDNFKRVNDTFGHMAGDQVLVHLGGILASAFRKSDIIARLGGDEFIVMMKDVRGREDLERKAELVCDRVRRTMDNRVRMLGLSASIGMAVTDGEATFKQLYGLADKALYQAKSRGKDQYSILPDLSPRG